MWTNRRRIFDRHCQLPTPVWVGNELWVYYSFRINCRSYIGRLVFDKNLRVLDENRGILSPGDSKMFDENGVMPSCVLMTAIGFRLYYTGWHDRPQHNPGYGQAIGLVASLDGVNFTRPQSQPILGVPAVPPIVNSPCLVGDRIYFSHGTGCQNEFASYSIYRGQLDSPISISNIKPVVICHNQAMSRPCVRITEAGEELWSAVRRSDSKYRIRHYLNGQIDCEDVLPVSETGWDSEMTCYPWLIELDGRTLMLYNGNGYGASGLGVAELV